MQLVPGGKDKYRLVPILLIVLVIIVSVWSAAAFAKEAGDDIRLGLKDRSQSIAAALEQEHILKLSGKEQDEKNPAYKALKERLAEVKEGVPTARSLYLAGERNGRLFFYVDSERPDDQDYSPAGEFYDDATPEFKAMFDNGQALVEGPVTDDFGTFISGLAPIFEPGTNKVIAVIGIDVAATTYYQSMAWAALVPLMAGFMLVLIILAFEWIRRRNTQLLNLRSELVSVASHELRNPVTGIRLAAENLQLFITDEQAKGMARAIYSSAIRLQDSTDEILELTHAMKQAKLSKTNTDIVALIHEVIDIQHLAAQQKSVQLVVDPSVPANLVVHVDASKIKRAMHNVISNAIKYTRDDSTVTIGYHSDEYSHYITITDQGIGIPKAEQQKVFAGFYRASNAVASNIPGTGMGLYLVKMVFEQHGGHVTCISEENKGTTFTVSLPKRS